MQAINIRQPKRHAKTIRERGPRSNWIESRDSSEPLQESERSHLHKQSRRRSVMARAIV